MVAEMVMFIKDLQKILMIMNIDDPISISNSVCIINHFVEARVPVQLQGIDWFECDLGSLMVFVGLSSDSFARSSFAETKSVAERRV